MSEGGSDGRRASRPTRDVTAAAVKGLSLPSLGASWRLGLFQEHSGGPLRGTAMENGPKWNKRNVNADGRTPNFLELLYAESSARQSNQAPVPEDKNSGNLTNGCGLLWLESFLDTAGGGFRRLVAARSAVPRASERLVPHPYISCPYFANISSPQCDPYYFRASKVASPLFCAPY